MMLLPNRLFDLGQYLERQWKWSQKTFGPPRGTDPSAGVRDHLRKELVEVEAAPSDIEEWIDLIILACDGALRVGYTPGDIVRALQLKQAKNEHRKWPDWHEAEPGKAIEHIRD